MAGHFALLVAVLVAPSVYAIGTLAGTDVSNTASVTFSRDGLNTTVTSNTVTFEVDRILFITVAESGGAATTVTPGSTNQVLTFTVVNNSNSVQDVRLFATNDAGGTTAFGGTDTFDPTSFAVFVESGGASGFQPGADTATFVDEASPGSGYTVYIVSSIPSAQVNSDTAGLTLTGVLAQSTSISGNYVATPGALATDSLETNVTLINDPFFVETVFGDLAGDLPADIAQDGRHSDDDEYDVITGVVSTLIKTQSVVDTSGGNACVADSVIAYTLTFTLIGNSPITGAKIVDLIPAGSTYISGSITLNGAPLSDAADTDPGLFNGTQIVVNLPTPLAAPSTQTVTFQARIN